MAELNIMIVGVGGMGIMSMANCIKSYYVKTQPDLKLVSMESRGVSQREGSVYAFIRIGVHNDNTKMSPKPRVSQVDIMLALEPLEFIRNISYLRPEGKVILNLHEVIPKSSILSGTPYPKIEQKLQDIEDKMSNVTMIQDNYTKKALDLGEKSIHANILVLKELSQIIEKKDFSKYVETFFHQFTDC